MGFFNGLPLESDGIMNLPCVQLVVILVLPRILHFAFLQRLLQPRLISQIVSGIILGPSWLGQIHGFTDLFFPAPSLPNLQTMSQIGAMLWLIMTGLHMKAELICNHKKQAIVTSFTAVGLAIVISPVLANLFEVSTYTNFNPPQLILLMVVLLSVPDEAVMTRILAERGLLSSKFASICTATGTVGLPICFLLLIVTLCLDQTPNDSARIVDAMRSALIVFGSTLVLTMTSRFLVPRLTQRGILRGRMGSFVFAVIMVLCFSAAWFTQALTVLSLLGAFFLGLFAFPKTDTPCIESALGPITTGVFLPVFFASVGLKIDFTLLEIYDIVMVCLLLGTLWSITFVGTSIASFIFSQSGFKNGCSATLLACKGVTAFTIFNIFSSTGGITPRFYALLALYALLSSAAASPAVALLQSARHYFKRSRCQKSFDDIPRILVVPGTGYLAPIAATVTAWTVNSLNTPAQVLFVRFIDDLDDVEHFIPLLREPISAAILSADKILGPCHVRWSGIQPAGQVSYLGVLAPSLTSAFLKLAEGNKTTQHQPYRYQLLGYDRTLDSRNVISAALSQRDTKVIVVTGQPTVVLSGAHSVLVVESGDRNGHLLKEWLNLKGSVVSVSYWRASDPKGRPPELAAAGNLLQLFAAIAKA